MSAGKKSLILFFTVASLIAASLFLFGPRYAYVVTAQERYPKFELSVRWRIVESGVYGVVFGGTAALVSYLWWARQEITHDAERNQEP